MFGINLSSKKDAAKEKGRTLEITVGPDEQIVVIHALFSKDQTSVKVTPESYVNLYNDEEDNRGCALLLIAYALCEASGVPSNKYDETLDGLKAVLDAAFAGKAIH